MKNFIEITGVNNVVYKVNIDQITHFYKPASMVLPMELRLETIFTRVFLSCGTEMATLMSVEILEELISKTS